MPKQTVPDGVSVTTQEDRSGRHSSLSLEATALSSSLVTFPVLGALAVIAGIALERAGIPFLTVFATFAIAVLIGLEARGSGWVKPRVVMVGLFALALMPLAHLRSSIVERTPDGLAGLNGQSITLDGESDGRFLTTRRGRLVITPNDALPAGFWRVQGRLEPILQTHNPGSFDYGAWLERRGVRHGLHVLSSSPLGDRNILEPVRDHLRAGVTAGLSSADAAFMQSLVLGWTDDLSNLPDPEPGTSWRTAFSRSGLAHVLALSGQQVTLLLIALGLVLAPLGVRRYPVLIGLLIAYVLIVGPGPSVVRAALMGGAALVTLWLGRGRLEILPALGLSAICTLLAGPRWIGDLGWQLSHLAVLGLAVFAPVVTRALGRFKPATRAPLLEHVRWRVLSFVALTLGTTLAAQAATLPLSASAFGIVPLASPVANLIAAPLVMVLVPLGFLAAVLGPALGGIVNVLVGPLSHLTLETARVLSAWPALPWGTVSGLGFMAYFASLTVFALALYGRVRWNLALTTVLVAMLVTAIPASRPHAEIVYLDVGQGDSSLIRLPEGDILVDGGGSVRSPFDVGERVVVPALRAMGVKRLLAVVATHADVDHIEGLVSVLARFPVGRLIVGIDKEPGLDPVWDAVIRAAKSHGVPIQSVRRGQTWILGQARLVFLNPTWTPNGTDNPNSVSFTLDYRGRRSLFLGDSPAEIEAQVFPGQLEVLKLAHHGSRFSTSETLLDRTHPRVAIISSGARNTYGHPAADVLERLRSRGISVYRTDRDGAIRYDLSTGEITVTALNPQTGQPGEPGRRPGVQLEARR
jgi:competence protein ComEC